MERRIVKELNAKGVLKAERTWGSQGTSRGLPPEVDVVITMNNKETLVIQCKLTKKYPKWLTDAFTPNVDIAIFDSPRMESIAIIRWELLRDLIFALAENVTAYSIPHTIKEQI